MEIADFFYTESQVARKLGVNRVTIWRWIKKGTFNIQRIGGVVFILRWEVDIITSQSTKKE